MAELDVVRRLNVAIPLRDGVTLAAGFARAGYVSVFADVRGRGDSDGVFEPYRNDGPDGAEVIAWAAAQEWCTGDVATWGASYGARIQWLTALQRPPALRAVVCLVTPSDPFVEIPTGLPAPMHINWQRFTDGRTPQFRDDVDWMAVYSHRPLATMDEAAGFNSPTGVRRYSTRPWTTGGSRSATSTASARSTRPCCTSQAGMTTKRSARRPTSPPWSPRGGRASGC